MKKNTYIYPAIFSYAEDGISISFPDFPEAFSCGKDDEEALIMAKDCLELHLFQMEVDKEKFPLPTKLINIKLKKNEVATLINVNMVLVRKEMDKSIVKKTLTIPKWLNDLGVEKRVNFSSVLKTALMQEFSID